MGNGGVSRLLWPQLPSGPCPVFGDGGVSQGGLPHAPGPWLGRQLRKWELEHQKARALPSSWTLGQTLSETSEEQKATPQALQAGPHHPEEEAHAPKEQEEEKVSGPHARGPGVPEVWGGVHPEPGLRGAGWLETGFQAWLCLRSAVWLGQRTSGCEMGMLPVRVGRMGGGPLAEGSLATPCPHSPA